MERKIIKINFPRFRVLRRTYVDLDVIIHSLCVKYVKLAIVIAPVAGWKIYELAKEAIAWLR